MKYHVTLECVGIWDRIVEVEAHSSEEAKELAGDYEYEDIVEDTNHEWENYEVVYVEEKPEVKP